MEIQKDYDCIENFCKVISKQIELESDYQEALPAYCDDIYRVTQCVGRSYITSVDLSYNEVKIFGKTEFSITYYNEKSNLCYVDFEEEFVKTAEAQGLSEAAFICADIYDKYCNYRVINQRRIDIHSSALIKLGIYDRVKCPMLCKCEGAKMKSELLNSCCVINSSVTRIAFDEEFSIPSGNPSINRIIGFTLTPSLNDVKVIKDKALIKAVASVVVLYVADNENDVIEKVQYSFNVSKIIEVAGINENDIPLIKIQTGGFYAKAKSSAGDDVNVISVFGDIVANAVFIRESETSLITDGYYPGHVTECDFSDYTLCADGKLISENKTINASLRLPDGISQILNVDVSIYGESVKKGRLFADIMINAVCLNSDGEVVSVSSTDSFESELNGFNDALSVINVNSFDYNVSSDSSLDVRINARLDIFAFNKVNRNVLNDINVEESTVSVSPLTLYFAKNGESVWDIAKTFSSDETEIKNENGISGETIDSDTVLIIPRA